MKVNKHFISQIIKQEIKSFLYEEEDIEKRFNALKRIKQMRDVVAHDPVDHLILQLNNLFIKYRDELMNNPTKNKKLVVDIHNILKNIAPNLQGSEILKLLDGKIDRQLLSFVSDLLKRDPNTPQGGYSLPDYEMPLELGREQGVMPYNRGQIDAFMRAPQHKGPYDNEQQIDFRSKQKNLTMEKNMKVTKDYLKQVIKEEMQKVINENRYSQKIKDVLNKQNISADDRQTYENALLFATEEHMKGGTPNVARIAKQAEQQGFNLNPELLKKLFLSVVSSGGKAITQPNIQKRQLAPAPAPLPPPK